MKVASPKSWQVIQHVREKFTCRDCEKISQAPAPFHVIARGWAGPSLLGMVLFEKFGQHQPLNRQAERYAKEGVPIVHLPPSMQKTGNLRPDDAAQLRRDEIGRRVAHFPRRGEHPNAALFTGGQDQRNIAMPNQASIDIA